MMKRVLMIFLIVVFVSGAMVYALWQKGYIRRWTDDGLVFDQLKLRMFPNDPQALNAVAKALQAKPEYQEAIKAYRHLADLKAFDQDVDARTAEDVIGRVTVLQQNYEKAIAADSDYREAYLNLAGLYEDLRRWPAAAAVYAALLERHPDSLEGNSALARLLLLVGESDEALKVLREYSTQQNPDENAWLAVIEIYNEVLKKSPEAEQWLRARRDAMAQFIALVNGKKSNPDSYFNLGILYWGMEDFSAAASAWQTALDLAPGHAPSLNRLGELNLRSGRLPAAINYFERAVKSQPRKSDGYFNLGRTYLAAGQNDRSEKFFREVLKISPKHEKALFSLGYLSETRGALREARDYYQAVIKSYPYNEEALYNLGNVDAALGNLAGARRAYRMVMQINPNHLNASVNACLLAFQGKEYESAVDICDNARLLGYEFPAGMEAVLADYR